MNRMLITSTMAAGVALAISWSVPPVSHAQQRGAPPATPQAAPAVPSEPAPKMPDGHPDLSGVWWTGGDVGGRGYQGGRGRGARGGPAPATYNSLFTPAAAEAAKKLADKDDPTLKCTPTALGTLNVHMFDVGAVGQILSTPKFVVMMTETFHSYRLIPT